MTRNFISTSDEVWATSGSADIRGGGGVRRRGRAVSSRTLTREIASPPPIPALRPMADRCVSLPDFQQTICAFPLVNMPTCGMASEVSGKCCLPYTHAVIPFLYNTTRRLDEPDGSPLICPGSAVDPRDTTATPTIPLHDGQRPEDATPWTAVSLETWPARDHMTDLVTREHFSSSRHTLGFYHCLGESVLLSSPA